MASDKKKSLRQVIRRQIGDRIAFAFGLLLILLCFVAKSELNVWEEQVRRKVVQACERLEDFTISQMLLDNEESIRLKIQQFNDENPYMHVGWEKSSSIATDTELRWHFPLSWSYQYHLREMGGQNFGTFKVLGSLSADKFIFSELLIRIVLFCVFSIMIGFILWPMSRSIPELLIFQPIHAILSSLSTRKGEKFEVSSDLDKTEEIQQIKEKVNALLCEAAEASKSKAIADIVGDVAHDIKSPLAALSSMESEIKTLPDEIRVMMRKSIAKVTDIANNLQTKYRTEIDSQGLSLSEDSSHLELLSTSVEFAVSEARYNYKLKDDLVIESKVEGGARFIFAKLDEVLLQRILSNLINNAVEAIGNKSGKVDVILREGNGEYAKITVKDNGNGISPDILPILGSKRVTFGKPSGSGRGIFNAKKTVESWGGTLEIKSKADEGTEIILLIPVSARPPWFAKEILFSEKSPVVVLDDDASVHHAWTYRFKQLSQFDQKQLLHFKTPSELKKWMSEEPEISKHSLYLVDCDLGKGFETGLDFIEKERLSHNAVLVTSRFDENQIRQRCIDIGLKILPKPLVPFVNLRRIPGSQLIDLALIDDDEIVRLNWRYRAKESKKKVAIFESKEEFLRARVAQEIPVYIDFHLEGEVSGLNVAQVLKNIGYQSLIITTGDARVKDVPPYIKAIRGKEFPDELSREGHDF